MRPSPTTNPSTTCRLTPIMHRVASSPCWSRAWAQSNRRKHSGKSSDQLCCKAIGETGRCWGQFQDMRLRHEVDEALLQEEFFAACSMGLAAGMTPRVEKEGTVTGPCCPALHCCINIARIEWQCESCCALREDAKVQPGQR